jgi:small conductance mechanosensitive channel
MKKAKKIIMYVVLALLLAVLLVPSINPLLDAEGKAATTQQLQETFGSMFSGVGTFSPAKLMTIAAVIILMVLCYSLLSLITKYVAKKQNRSQSIVGLFVALLKLVIGVVCVVWVLNILGVNMTGVFASLGIMSMIIGFGAQSLIEDSITGIFIIFEGDYHVGDIIVLDEFRGVVRSIGIRTTIIEDDGGNLKIINNSDIRNIQNRSRNASLAVSDIGIGYDADLKKVEQIISENLQAIYERNTDRFLTVPRYLGVQELAESAVVLRFVVDVTEENVFGGRRALSRELKLLFDENNINIPFPQIVVHQEK